MVNPIKRNFVQVVEIIALCFADLQTQDKECRKSASDSSIPPIGFRLVEPTARRGRSPNPDKPENTKFGFIFCQKKHEFHN